MTPSYRRAFKLSYVAKYEIPAKDNALEYTNLKAWSIQGDYLEVLHSRCAYSVLGINHSQDLF